MIHLTPEGHCAKLGLNIGIHRGRSLGFSLRWVWFDLRTLVASSRKFRFRVRISPHLLTGHDTWDVLQDYLFSVDKVIIDRRVAEDHGISTKGEI